MPKDTHSKLKLSVNRKLAPGFVDTRPKDQEINISKLLLEQIENKKGSKTLTIGSKDFDPVAFLERFHEKTKAEMEGPRAPEYKIEYNRKKNVVYSKLEYFDRVFTYQAEKTKYLKLEKNNARRNVAFQCIESIKNTHLFDAVIAKIQIEDNIFCTEMEEIEHHSTTFLDAFHQKLIIGDWPKYIIFSQPAPPKSERKEKGKKVNKQKTQDGMEVDERNQQIGPCKRIELDEEMEVDEQIEKIEKNETGNYFACELEYLGNVFISGVHDSIEKARRESADKCISYLKQVRPYDVQLVKELKFKRNPNLSKLIDLHKIKVETFNIHDKNCTVPQSKLWIDKIAAEDPHKRPHVILQEFCQRFDLGQANFTSNKVEGGRFNYSVQIDGRNPVRTSVCFAKEIDAKDYVAKRELSALLRLYETKEQEEIFRITNDYKLKIGLISKK